MKTFKQKPTIYYMIGPAGSGKSTWIQHNLPGVPVLSRDIIRESLGMAKPGEKTRGTLMEELEVTRKYEQQKEQLLGHREIFVIDNTGTNKKYTEPEVKNLKTLGYTVIGVFMRTPVEVCIKRRENQVPPEVIRKMSEGMKEIQPEWFNEVIRVSGAQ